MRISDWSSDVCSSDLGGARCVATASGMAAVLTLCLSLLKQGDHIVSSRGLFGSTIGLFNNFLAKFGISVSYVDLPDLAAWDAAVQPNTKLLFAETPTNPLVEIADIRALADIAHRRGEIGRASCRARGCQSS